MKVNNYLVTGADLATMGYVQKPGTTPPLDGNIMSKGEASANYYIDQTANPWSTYPDTRAPKYQDFPCPCVGSVTVDNSLVGGFDQYIEYQDCSGNVKTYFIPYGQAAAIQGCITQDPGGYTGCGILRGSVIGINLASVVYADCCPGFTACTTSTTTTIYIPSCNYNGLTVVCNSVPATLAWSFNESGGTVGNMDLYVNGSLIESRSNPSSGTYNVYEGDQIYVELTASGCTGFDDFANAYTSGIIVDASCANGSTTLTTAIYTVTSGDLGNTIYLDTFTSCSAFCV